ncbi:MAG TPA: hypothetical protein VMS08_04145 [Candidatus Saccharimonadia bacterium]|nr:hypothetical protein [Candidatus Saccharimonadia bacterium]
MRDTVKTLAGLVIIAAIVVATFVYGNTQRQSQLKHDQQIKLQQQASASGGKSPKDSASPTAQPVAAVPSSSPSSATNTAPVESPQANSVQGSSLTSPTPTAIATPIPTPAPTPAKVAVQTPRSATAGAPLPQTGSPIGGLLGVAAVTGAVVALRRSRLAVLEAARSSRLR